MEQNVELMTTTEAESKAVMLCNVNLHVSEKKLIELLRSIKDGEISSIKIQNGLPVFYIIDLKDRRFV
jgi:bisphosphoglycerate-dependent phosphoglycerate mutase